MIVRIWHGYTTSENAQTYEKLLYEEVWPGIAAKNVKGYKSIELIKRDLENEVEFITIMRFESLKDVIEFAGDDYITAHVPQKARQVLNHFDTESQHYEPLKLINY